MKPHPIEGAFLALLVLTDALLTVAVPLLALVLTLAGWKPKAPDISPDRRESSKPSGVAPAAILSDRRTVAQLRCLARRRGIPSAAIRSARKAEILHLLSVSGND
jgi:hypothetical protein